MQVLLLFMNSNNIRFFELDHLLPVLKFSIFLNFLNVLKNQKSQIALNESKLRLACYECGNKMAKRQPLVKTNGILFMKNREEHVLEQFGIFENYENCAEQAFTRSEIVQGMCYIYVCTFIETKVLLADFCGLISDFVKVFEEICSKNSKF